MDAQRPSQVFATRLEETRKARGVSREALAQRMRHEGRPVNKTALLRIEKGGRGLLLDEAFALAHSLNAAPAHLLTPLGNGFIAITGNFAMDADALRDWLTLGLPAIPSFDEAASGETEQRARALLEQRLTQLAGALVDASRGRDREGCRAVVRAIEMAVDEYRESGSSSF
jgi:transcriptional regulator with XRE-family HTH domain